MQEIIPVELKDWLSWKNDNEYQNLISYVRVYTIPDKEEILFLRHIEENKKIRNGETKKIEYSIITKVSGRFNCSSGWNEEKSFNEYCSKINREQLVFSFHHSESHTIETFLNLFQAKKGKKVIFDYWPRNDSTFTKEVLHYHNESITLSFYLKDKKYSISCNHIPNSDLTKFIAYDIAAYKVQSLYNEIYPEKIPDISSCTVKEQSPIVEA